MSEEQNEQASEQETEQAEQQQPEIGTLKRILEGALLAAGEALSVDRLLNLFDEAEQPEKKTIVSALKALQDDLQDRGYTLEEVASGWRFQVCPDLAPWVNRLWEEKPQKYSRALLETLSLIAYRQPITRGDIEEVRGVAVSSHIIKTLAEREWIKVVGHRDVPGRPSLYATTRQFLDYFGLKSLDELPSLGELKDIDSLNKNLNLNDEADEDEQIAQAREGSGEGSDGSDDSVEPSVDLDAAQVGQAQAEADLEEGFGRAPVLMELDEGESEETALDDAGVGYEEPAPAEAHQTEPEAPPEINPDTHSDERKDEL